jgi:hypothetical protein
VAKNKEDFKIKKNRVLLGFRYVVKVLIAGFEVNTSESTLNVCSRRGERISSGKRKIDNKFLKSLFFSLPENTFPVNR